MNLRLHDYEEAAEILRVKVSWLQQRIKTVPHTKLGGTVYFTEEHLRRIVDQFTHDPVPAKPRRAVSAAPDMPVPLPMRARVRA